MREGTHFTIVIMLSMNDFLHVFGVQNGFKRSSKSGKNAIIDLENLGGYEDVSQRFYDQKSDLCQS